VTDTVLHGHDAEGLEVTYKGQLYRRIAIQPHIRADGTMTKFAVWQSACPTCGGLFTFTSSRTTRLRWPTRRCPAHRAPGRRVVFK
jgi:hypothetical protein